MPNNKPFYAVDFEYRHVTGEKPIPHCCVFENLSTWEIERYFIEPGMPCPIPDLHNCIVIAHNLAAEASCFDALNWPMPTQGLCTLAEFRNLTNGTGQKCNLGAVCNYFNVPFTEPSKKESMRDLAIRGGPFTPQEEEDLLNYCEDDVRGLSAIVGHLKPFTETGKIRGRYLLESGCIQNRGLPVDVKGLAKWEKMKGGLRMKLAEGVNNYYKAPIYENGSFRNAPFKDFVKNNKLTWPKLESGNLDLKEKTIKTMSVRYPELNFFRQTKKTLSQLTSGPIPVGSDGRHRFNSIYFSSSTGRTQAIGNCILLGPSWMRGFIQAPKDRALIIADYKSQEILIAAACSQDEAMLSDYQSGDFYLSFAKRAGALEDDARREDSPQVEQIRNLYKRVSLAIQYGMGAKSLAETLGQSEHEARKLIKQAKEIYPKFWEWRDRVGNYVGLNRTLKAVLGWQLSPPYRSKSSYETGKSTYLSSLNFPLQASGSDILRACVINLAEEGYEICATQHDSVFVEMDVNEISEKLNHLETIMENVSCPLLNGHSLLVESKVLMPGERYLGNKDKKFWRFISCELGLANEN